MKGGDHFSIATAWSPEVGKHVRAQTATCGKCGKKDSVHDAGERAKPVSMMAEKFRQKGWTISSRSSGDLCPRCASGKAPLSPAQKRAAFCKIAGVPRAGQTARTEDIDMPAAEAPKLPTREDRRRILDALDEHYLPEKDCYAKAFSDATLSAKLNVPRAWVAEERDRAFGPDVNEARGEMAAQASDLERRAKSLEEQGLALAAEAESIRKDAAKLTVSLSYAA